MWERDKVVLLPGFKRKEPIYKVSLLGSYYANKTASVVKIVCGNSVKAILPETPGRGHRSEPAKKNCIAEKPALSFTLATEKISLAGSSLERAKVAKLIQQRREQSCNGLAIKTKIAPL